MINFQSRAWRATIAASLLFLEGLVVLSLDGYLIIQNFIADNVDDRHALLGEILYATFGALILFFLSWGFFKERTSTRAPAVLLNLIFLGISTYMFSEKLILLGIATLLISLATLVSAISVIPEK
jgi:NADH:ubiquinone oxidoreductase subunit 2 (subunit N)